MSRLLVAAGLLLLGMIVGAGLLGVGFVAVTRHEAAIDLDRQLDEEVPILPRWARLTMPCLPPTRREAGQDRAMAATATAFSDDAGLISGTGYAFGYFGWH